MAGRWILRRAHMRRKKNGGMGFVEASWAFYAGKGEEAGSSYRHDCPECGAAIITVKMPRGGWVHFEGTKGLGKVKHPCLHRGEDLSKVRDGKTPDFFERGEGDDTDSCNGLHLSGCGPAIIG